MCRSFTANRIHYAVHVHEFEAREFELVKYNDITLSWSQNIPKQSAKDANRWFVAFHPRNGLVTTPRSVEPNGIHNRI
eukprot:m.1347624 g.1347624  ORF g.1347624 m.1347624 type:complete len:78 (-) comp24912_c0_seq12:251-484(-)